MKKLLVVVLLVSMMVMTGCGRNAAGKFEFDFSESDQGWVGAFTDYPVNVDKGAQSEGGKNAVVVGDGAKLVNDEFEVYELKTLSNSIPLELETDSDGNLWVFVGTDSGFEGKTVLYYTGVKVDVKQKS